MNIKKWLALTLLAGVLLGTLYVRSDSLLGQLHAIFVAAAALVVGTLSVLWYFCLKLSASVGFYDLFWLALVPRLSRAVLFDAPWRWFVRNVAPLLLLSARYRAITRRRAQLLKRVLREQVTARWQGAGRHIEPYCGRHTMVVMWGVVVLLVSGLIYLFLGIVFALAVVPLPPVVLRMLRWLLQVVNFVLSRLVQLAKQVAVRTGVFFFFARLWSRFGFRVVTEEHRRLLRARRRAFTKVVIRKRNRVGSDLGQLRTWEKLWIWWLSFWDRRFAPLEGRTSAPAACERITKHESN